MGGGSGIVYTDMSLPSPFLLRIELFIRWIKQNLRIKTFYGTSENAVKAQIGFAVSVYVLVAITKKQLKIEASLHTILKVLSVQRIQGQYT
ncbi:MAG: hypothetical protein A2X82_16135 [Geobacteraceae bacterium GWC2_55_20]|nr:MAG: hypothetical protein A2X82_16135 [Geobacteraceae bacterium GWC2_55_20]OGU24982.1 MAG: hypothetical protein A2X85_11515 [Geobacteraceae bacterium GWF2_54_21]